MKIFKKIRRQGYRRTRGHRQLESVLRVTAIAGGGKTETWDGKVDLTPKAVLDACAPATCARAADELPEGVDAETVVRPEGRGKSARLKARVIEGDDLAEGVAGDEVVTDDAAETRELVTAIGRLDAGALDRLTLTPERLDELEHQLRILAGLPHSSASSTPGNSRTVSPSAAGASR